MEKLSPENYIEGIRRAKEEGLIKYHDADDVLGPPDTYSHIPKHGVRGSFHTTTRHLNPVAKDLLNLTARKRFRFLELGSGAGVAAGEVHKNHPNAHISTVALTPVNPYIRVMKHVREIREEVAKIMENRKTARILQQKVRLATGEAITDFTPYKIAIDFEMAFMLHNEFRLKIFEILKKPFVQEQHIGFFPRDVALSPRSYDFAYDVCGPFLHGNDSRECLMAAHHALRDDGALVFERFDPDKCSLKSHTDSMLKSLLGKGDLLLLEPHGVNHVAVLLKKDHPLREKIGPYLEKHEGAGAGPFYYVPDLRRLITLPRFHNPG